MIVVANTHLLNVFRKIPIFKLDLGEQLIGKKSERVEIKDTFMLKYLNMTGKQVLTYGTIGKLIFYQDFSLPSREFYVFNNDTIYSLMYTDEDSKLRPENYLASIVREISEKEGIKVEDTTEEIKKDPDIKLPKDQYLEEMIKKRNAEHG